MAESVQAPVQRTAETFTNALRALATGADVERNQQYFRTSNDFLGVRMGQVFKLAKDYIDLPIGEINRLLDSDIHEVRVGAVSVMGHQAVRKRTTPEHLGALYDLYLRRADRINTWDLVDVSAHKVIGGYLLDKPRDVLYILARSDNWWERRIAIFATLWFLRVGEVDDTFALAEMLVHDEHDLIHKVVGGTLREAGKHDQARLLEFLERHAAEMPRIALRFAMEHLPEEQRNHYRSLGKKPAGSPKSR